MKEHDFYLEEFKDIEDFSNFLYERERQTKRIPIHTDDVKFYVIGNENQSEADLLNKYSISDIETYKDTLEHTNIACTLYKDYLLGDSSWTSLCGRIGIFGPGFKKLSPESKVKDLNERFHQLKKIVYGIVCYDKVRAVMSDDYGVIPAVDVFMRTLEKVELRFQDYSFVSAFADHNVTKLKIVFPELKEVMSSLYGKDEYTPGLVIETSDTGFSGNYVSSYWKTNNRSGFVGSESIYFKHYGKVDISKILEQLPNIFLKYQNLPKKFASLMQVKVYRPVDLLKSACKNIGVPKGLTGRAAEQFEDYLSSKNIKVVTAYDICREILGIPNLIDDRSIATRMEDIVGKAVNVNFEKLIKLIDEGLEDVA